MLCWMVYIRNLLIEYMHNGTIFTKFAIYSALIGHKTFNNCYLVLIPVAGISGWNQAGCTDVSLL